MQSHVLMRQTEPVTTTQIGLNETRKSISYDVNSKISIYLTLARRSAVPDEVLQSEVCCLGLL